MGGGSRALTVMSPANCCIYQRMLCYFSLSHCISFGYSPAADVHLALNLLFLPFPLYFSRIPGVHRAHAFANTICMPPPPFSLFQEYIAHTKEFIASCGTYANLVRQAKSRQKILDKMVEAGLIEEPFEDPKFKFGFPETSKMPPPLSE